MKIIELLTSSDKWIKGEYAKDRFGNTVYSKSRFATCWCLIGAIKACYSEGEHDLILFRICETLFGNSPESLTGVKESIIHWNDDPNRTFEEVKSLVEKLDI